MKNWILHKSFYPINGVEYGNNDEKMSAVALQFSAKSGRIINGCIGALDGWAVKIQRPGWCSKPSIILQQEGVLCRESSGGSVKGE